MINPLAPFVIYYDVLLPLEQDEESWMAKSFVLSGEVCESVRYFRIIARMLFVIEAGPGEAQDSASTRGTDGILLLHIPRRLTLELGPYHFFELTSLRIWLSKLRSATKRFKRAFSASRVWMI